MINSQKEFESILAALGERELSEWERQRLWELIAEEPDRVQDYLAICQLNEALGELDASSLASVEIELPPVNIIAIRPEWAPVPKRRYFRWRQEWNPAAIGAGALLLLFMVWSSTVSQTARREHEAQGQAAAKLAAESTPEATYSKMKLASSTGSLNRPPANFASLREPADGPIGFNERIRPILSENCFSCHGPDSGSRKGGLRLDTRDGALAKGAIVPGDPAKSEAAIRILSEDPDEQMPPLDSHKILKPEDKALILEWIKLGAVWEEHWAFIPPARPEVPKVDDPAKWARNPVDHFILDKLRALGLEPSEEASALTLARRAALDVTGLPPEPALLDRFLADRSPQAYERYLDELFKSEHAGEHRARYWLDAARYGDTHGMHLDNYREIWPYRDWVIRAFNRNLSFDRFVVDQLAGDLLPNASQDQVIATGFNRCNVTTSEGGSIQDEVNVRYMVDRVETTSTVFLGLTTGCSVCHDHKYDPITQKEFYQLGAFFNNTTQPAMDGNQKDSPPVVVLPRPEDEAEWRQLREDRGRLREELKALAVDSERVRDWWIHQDETPLHPVLEDGLAVWLPLNERAGRAVTAQVYGERRDVALPETAEWDPERPGIRFQEKAPIELEAPGLAKPSTPMSVSFWVRTPDNVVSSVLFNQLAKNEQGKEVGWKISLSVQGALTFEIRDAAGKKISGLLPGDEALAPRTWQHVCVRYSGGQSNSSITILVNGVARNMRNASEQYLEAEGGATGPLKVGDVLASGALSGLRIYERWLADEEVKLLAAEEQFRTLWRGPHEWDRLNPDQRALLTQYHRLAVDLDGQRLTRQLADTQLRRDYIYARSETTLVTQEMPGQPRAFVLERGEYDQRREEVAPGVPAALPPMAADSPRNRLGLAEWLVDARHPLTARVTVNRLWQSVFGAGLVKTSEDFGVMGERPTHPALLDWLSVEFMQSGWDMNHVLRLMLTSATYRQSMVNKPEHLRIDPENRYLARAPRVRLDAEVIRDQALSVSGLLKPQVGGPSVKPYQPGDLWKAVAFVGSNTSDFKQDTGEALYRRSLYTFWKRTSPPPSMAAFDAPSREQCTVRRERTNTPMQALVLMNDPQFVEAARRLAERTVQSAPNDRSRAEWAFRTVLVRPATESDLADLVTAAEEFREHFAQHPDDAKALVATGDSAPDGSLDVTEVATWTMVANTLMNRDDFINET